MLYVSNILFSSTNQADTMASQAKYLSGDKDSIKEFIDKFDVKQLPKPMSKSILIIVLLRYLFLADNGIRSSYSTATVCEITGFSRTTSLKHAAS